MPEGRLLAVSYQALDAAYRQREAGIELATASPEVILTRRDKASRIFIGVPIET